MKLGTQIILLVLWAVVVFGSIAYCNQDVPEPPCEVYNIDTDQCEALSDQNLSINPILWSILSSVEE